MAMKNPSSVARWNWRLANNGWLRRGSWIRARRPNKTVKPENKIVSSNMIGKNAGTVKMFAGFAWTMVG